jgi:hypothetical protein
MAVMAMMMQLFLSKVAFLSGAALLIAKIALLFSTLVRCAEKMQHAPLT